MNISNIPISEEKSVSILVDPSNDYRDEFLAAQREFAGEGQRRYDLQRIANDFPRFVHHLLLQRDRSQVEPGLVPFSDYWLIDNDEYIGRLSVRHELNDFLFRIGGHIGYEIRPSKRRRGYGYKILFLGLEKARELGFRRVLLTCDEDNIGSKKIIERNGGVFENATYVAGGSVRKLRYWIDLTNLSNPTNPTNPTRGTK
jgi:predicted acetyltransferase